METRGNSWLRNSALRLRLGEPHSNSQLVGSTPVLSLVIAAVAVDVAVDVAVAVDCWCMHCVCD